MHRYWFVVGTAVLAFLAGVSLTLAAQTPMDAVTQAEEAWTRARVAGDKAGYASVLADDFTWTFITGRVANKQQTVDRLQAAPNPETDRGIRMYRDAAIVVGTAKLTFEDRPITERFVRVWTKSDGVWRAVLFQATEVRE